MTEAIFDKEIRGISSNVPRSIQVMKPLIVHILHWLDHFPLTRSLTHPPTPLLKKRTRQPLRRLANLPPQLGTVLRRPSRRHAAANAVRVGHVVKGQDAVRGIVAPLVDKVDGHATACGAAVLQQGVREPADRAKVDRRARCHVLREDADSALVDVAAQADAGACGTLIAARGDGPADGDGLGLGNADDVVAVSVGGGVGVGVGPDGVTEALGDRFRGLVVEAGAITEAGAPAVNAEGGGGRSEEEGEGAKAEDRGEVVHFEIVWVMDWEGWFGFGRVDLEIGLSVWLGWLCECCRLIDMKTGRWEVELFLYSFGSAIWPSLNEGRGDARSKSASLAAPASTPFPEGRSGLWTWW